LGVVLLGETVMLHGWSGVILLIGGIALVATDPGTKVEEGGAEGGEEEAPPLIVWIGPALFCALSYAMYNSKTRPGNSL
jgi:drug/metabolite transporter (DMT)-like permease